MYIEVLLKNSYEALKEVYDVGSLDRVDVKRIAEIVSEEMELQGLEFKFTGGVDGVVDGKET
jgi:hypothetical protein